MTSKELKTHRKALGLSVEALAEKAHYNTNHVYQMEMGYRPVGNRMEAVIRLLDSMKKGPKPKSRAPQPKGKIK